MVRRPPARGATVTASTVRAPRAQRMTARSGGDITMSALLLLALALAITGLHGVLEGITWWFPAFGVMFVVFTVSAVARFFLARRWLGSVAGTLAAILSLTGLFAAGTAILAVIPTGATLDRFAQLFAAANESIASQSLPAIPTTGIQFLICAVVAAIAVLMDAVAIWLRAPALAGVPLLAVVVAPSFILASLADGLTFELTAVAYLLILVARGRRIQPAVAVSAGVLAVLGALAVPSALPSVTAGGTTGSGIGVLAETINPIVNLGADLRQSDSTPALSYTTTSSTGEYLRLTTLDSFQGQQWAPATPRLSAANTVKSIGAPPGLTSGVKVGTVSTTIQVAGATSPWLPVPYPALSISGLTGAWAWQPGTLTVRSNTTTMQGQHYSVASLNVQPTRQQMESAGSSADNPLARVPAGLDPIVAATARKVVGNAKTDFDKAVALQNWFRGGTFTYSTKTPATAGFDGSGLNVIVPFLKAKSGYCVHFATTMAVMARTLGIPSRVAVGFLPGRVTHPGNGSVAVFQVSSTDLHAWPELYFAGVGWVRFEPTPGKGFEPRFPQAPAAAAPVLPDSTSAAVPTGTATKSPVRAPNLPEQAAPAAPSALLSSSPAVPTVSYGALGVLALLLLAAAPTVARIGIRRGRLDKIRRGVDPAGWSWRELRDTARDLGVAASDSSTPAEFAAQLAEYLARAPGRTAAGARALEALRSLVEDEAYGVPAYRYNGELMAEQLTIVLRGIRRATRPANRVIATVVPPTFLDRVLGRTAAQA